MLNNDFEACCTACDPRRRICYACAMDQLEWPYSYPPKYVELFMKNPFPQTSQEHDKTTIQQLLLRYCSSDESKRSYDAKRGANETGQSINDNNWKDWDPKQSASSSNDQWQKPERKKVPVELSTCASCSKEYNLAPVRELWDCMTCLQLTCQQCLDEDCDVFQGAGHRGFQAHRVEDMYCWCCKKPDFSQDQPSLPTPPGPFSKDDVSLALAGIPKPPKKQNWLEEEGKDLQQDEAASDDDEKPKKGEQIDEETRK